MRTIRAALLAVGAVQLTIGVLLLLAPHFFYDEFPGLGRQWVAALPPYSQHALTDFGGALLGIGTATLVAGVTLRPGAVQVACVANIVQGGAHFAYHLTRADALPTADTIVNQALIAIGPLVCAAVLLALPRAASLGAEGDGRGRAGGLAGGE